jgi:hypothetical protein
MVRPFDYLLPSFRSLNVKMSICGSIKRTYNGSVNTHLSILGSKNAVTKFIGRQEELNKLVEFLDGHR